MELRTPTPPPPPPKRKKEYKKKIWATSSGGGYRLEIYFRYSVDKIANPQKIAVNIFSVQYISLLHWSLTRVWHSEDYMRSHVEMFKLELSIQAYSVNRAGKSPEFSFDKKKKKRSCGHLLTFFHTQTTWRCIILFNVPVVVAKASFVQCLSSGCVSVCVCVCGDWKGTVKGVEGEFVGGVFFFLSLVTSLDEILLFRTD